MSYHPAPLFLQLAPFLPHIAAAVTPEPPVAGQIRRLGIVAGTFIVADICFWNSQRTESSGTSETELLSALQCALDQYQEKKHDVIQTICEMPRQWHNQDIPLDLMQLIFQYTPSSSANRPRAL
ncbi:hypothetical protein FRB93_013653 [Tulasnella sp. JGI-2019a]|nr:hypothetical protein FRB93_013653 [Tulasnella sp. JGI-2019a]